MEKVNKFLLMIIAMMAIMILAVGIDKGMQYYEAQKWEKERVARYEQARADVADMQLTISELSKDQESLEAFIEENKAYFDETEDFSEWETVSSQNLEEETQEISGNGMNSISENELDGESISENKFDGESISDNKSDGGSISDNEFDGQSVSENGYGMDQVSGIGSETVSGNTLIEKRKIRGSYMETLLQNKADKKIIEDSEIDFSKISIACLGDSITEATNLDDMEDYQQYAYPTRLKEILGAKSVTNLGIGGSSIGRYWDKAFVERYREIPEDVELIIVMGGTNDGFCLTKEELGSMEERKERTFIGDLDELMRGLKENYPDATIVFATPLPNILHDILRKERDYLLPQGVLVSVIRQLGAEYEIPVIDLYNSNMLDTHDAAVIYNYMPDGVHCNLDGYQILAEHFAAELIRIFENKEEME